MYKQKMKNVLMTLIMVLPLLLSAVSGFTQVAQAKTMNLQDTGSLTIHKFLNPNYKPASATGASNEFQGDGTASGANVNGEGNPNITGTPLAGAKFQIVGPLSDEQVASLVDGNGNITRQKAKDFLGNLPQTGYDGATLVSLDGTTDADGILEFEGLPVNTKELDKNRWLVVETSAPDVVDTPAVPVIVNVPVSTVGTATNAYNYDVHLFMKNYSSSEPEIEKEIDESTHSTGQIVDYTLKITALPDDLATFERLEVYDKLDSRLNLLDPIADSFGDVVLKDAAGKVKLTFVAGTDYVLINGGLEKNGTVNVEGSTKGSDGQFAYWGFTKAGLAKLVDLKEGDYIELPFFAQVNDAAKDDEAIPNEADLGFENEWGYGTKPVDPENPEIPETPEPSKPVPPKPSETVNTISGKAEFVKVDADDETKVLEGAEFIVKDVPTKDINTTDEDGNKITIPAGTTIYAVINENGRVERWTTVKADATPVTSDAKGQFNVSGLAYTNEVHFSKEYIFEVLGDWTDPETGEVSQIVTGYARVAAAKRTSATTQEEIDAEIQEILTAHPNYGEYKESETNPATIDYLGAELHDYALEEITAPDGYAPLKEDLKFTVPTKIVGGQPVYGEEVDVPNKKIPDMPITGGIGTVIFLVVGLALMGGAYMIRQRRHA